MNGIEHQCMHWWIQYWKIMNIKEDEGPWIKDNLGCKMISILGGRHEGLEVNKRPQIKKK